MNPKILVINPGSTSLKIAIFEKDKLILKKIAKHDTNVIRQFKTAFDQLDFRLNIVLDFIKAENINLKDIDIFVGRGGLIRPLESGTYLVNEEMIDDLVSGKYGIHACNFGGIIASRLAKTVNKEAYIVDPVIIDEFDEVARVSGYKGIERL